MIDKSKLLNASGARLVKALFIEFDHIYADTIAVYTLAKEDKTKNGITYPSLRRLYLECEDVSESTFVELYMYDLKQWEQLCASPFLRDEISQWRKELRLLKLSQAIASLEEDVVKGTASSMASAKFLIEKVYGLSDKGKGRPSNKQTTPKEDNHLFDKELEDDVKRTLLADANK